MKKIIDKPLLSICIPSHNRFDGIKRIIDSLRESKSKKFEIIVLDNGSNEDIFSVIKESGYIHIVKREQIISGKLNPRDSLNYGRGLYRMVCLDKDFIDGKCLDSFLSFLENTNITGGYCKLNTSIYGENIIILSGQFSDWAYKINHPSGTFIREDLLLVNNMNVDYINVNSIYYDFPFLNDIMLAQCLNIGNIAIYNSPLVYTESVQVAANTKTLSYNSSNLFFCPINKRKQFEVYLYNLNSLNVSHDVYKKTALNIIKRILIDSTVVYYNIIQSEEICAHYGIKNRKLTIKEIINEARSTISAIMHSTHCYVGKFSRCIVIIKTMVKIYISIIYNKTYGLFMLAYRNVLK